MNMKVSVALFLCLFRASSVSADVLCGGHYAGTCAQCPEGANGEWKGARWCNGDCTWDADNNECVVITVSCGGGNSALACAECPIDNCSGGDCAWHPHTNLCRDAFSDEVRTASVHLWYNAPIAQPAWWFQKVIPTATADATYFASNGHRFGYGGIQQLNANSGRVLFSLWDQGECDQDADPNCDAGDIASTVACGEGVTCTDFGGEGTGRKSYFDTSAFVENEEYFFVTQAAYLGNRRMEYTGYFFSEGSWRLLSRIQVATNAKEQWWLGGIYSFVEQWTAVDTTSDRAALYGPSYMASTDASSFEQVPRATFTHGTLENHERVNAWQAGADQDYAVGIETGGDANRDASRGDSFDYVFVDPHPTILDFKDRISCLNAAQTKDEIETCLTENIFENGPKVSCGNHEASSCNECPQGNGAAWCSGECTWTMNDECVHEEDVTTSPTEAPTDGSSCEDSADWRFLNYNDVLKNCAWVARKMTSQRCKKNGFFLLGGEDESPVVSAADGCPETCGTC